MMKKAALLAWPLLVATMLSSLAACVESPGPDREDDQTHFEGTQT